MLWKWAVHALVRGWRQGDGSEFLMEVRELRGLLSDLGDLGAQEGWFGVQGGAELVRGPVGRRPNHPGTWKIEYVGKWHPWRKHWKHNNRGSFRQFWELWASLEGRRENKQRGGLSTTVTGSAVSPCEVPLWAILEGWGGGGGWFYKIQEATVVSF